MKKQLFIAGQWVDAERHTRLTAPYSGELLAEIPFATESEVDSAIQAASDARRMMAAMPAHKRYSILIGVSNLLEERKEEAARIIAQEAAKPVTTARGEVARTIETYRFSAEEAKRLTGEMIPMDAAASGENRIAYTMHVPLGVVGAITPFNFPMNLVAHKVGPALAAGNTVVLKPASQTPLSAFFIAKLFATAGLPAGALNVITGSGSTVGHALVTDPRIHKITFTGSAAVGMEILRLAGMKKVTLELGSNSAVIVDAGTDIEKIAKRCVTGAFSYQGQVCISVQRIYVHHTVYHPFLEALVRCTKNLKGDDPLADETDFSCMISSSERDRLTGWISEAVADGASIACGGTVEHGMLMPTILTGAAPSLKISCQEAFGPVVLVNPVESVNEAIQHVNESRFGLQAGIFTNNIQTALFAASELQVGGVMVNDIPTYRVDHMPYGGVKDSGTGREGVPWAIREMTDTKLVVLNRN
jgi:acyl-CoA reductase-like NAD-dependent aldehyde dehydrogenase